ncbi:MAG: hypothetical protein HY399_00730 [Elusimicrobia bacterium]|nr:hypothetical protein [Elusimicrobiota bacterium]
MELLRTPEFYTWKATLDEKGQAQVDSRLYRIREYDHFGDCRNLGNDLFELKWKSGRRVYYSVIERSNGEVALLLLGGDKNGQDRDIKQARKILERETA